MKCLAPWVYVGGREGRGVGHMNFPDWPAGQSVLSPVCSRPVCFPCPISGDRSPAAGWEGLVALTALVGTA